MYMYMPLTKEVRLVRNDAFKPQAVLRPAKINPVVQVGFRLPVVA